MLTFSRHLISATHREPTSPEGFVLLMLTLENAARIISAHVRKVGLSDMLGLAGSTNSSGDSVKRIDVFADELLTSLLSSCGQVVHIGSEEQPELAHTPYHNAPYSIFFDPLDGSNNIDTGAPLGTIFSIYHRTSCTAGQKIHLPHGCDQIAAGYILYGSTTVLVYATAEGVEGFTLDPATGCFLHSHPHLSIKSHPKLYIANEANEPLWEDDTRTYVNMLKQVPHIKQRNFGCLVSDFHAILIAGGVGIYPADTKHTEGKLRLMYEVNPMAYIARAAGGRALSDSRDPLTITPMTLHQKVPVVIECAQTHRQT